MMALPAPRAWRIVGRLHCAFAVLLLIGGVFAIVMADKLLAGSCSSSDDLLLQGLLAIFVLMMLSLRLLGVLSIIVSGIVGVTGFGLMHGRPWGYWSTQAHLVGFAILGVMAIVSALLMGRLESMLALPLLQVMYSVCTMVILYSARRTI